MLFVLTILYYFKHIQSVIYRVDLFLEIVPSTIYKSHIKVEEKCYVYKMTPLHLNFAFLSCMTSKLNNDIILLLLSTSR